MAVVSKVAIGLTPDGQGAPPRTRPTAVDIITHTAHYASLTMGSAGYDVGGLTHRLGPGPLLRRRQRGGPQPARPQPAAALSPAQRGTPRAGKCE